MGVGVPVVSGLELPVELGGAGAEFAVAAIAEGARARVVREIVEWLERLHDRSAAEAGARVSDAVIRVSMEASAAIERGIRMEDAEVRAAFESRLREALAAAGPERDDVVGALVAEERARLEARGERLAGRAVEVTLALLAADLQVAVECGGTV